MSFYTTNNPSTFTISNVACETCNASELVSTTTFLAGFGVRTGAFGGLEGYVNPLTPFGLYGQFQFTFPSSSMQIQFIGSECVRRVVAVVSVGYNMTLTHTSDTSFTIDLSGLPSTWYGTMTVTVQLK